MKRGDARCAAGTACRAPTQQKRKRQTGRRDLSADRQAPALQGPSDGFCGGHRGASKISAYPNGRNRVKMRSGSFRACLRQARLKPGQTLLRLCRACPSNLRAKRCDPETLGWRPRVSPQIRCTPGPGGTAGGRASAASDEMSIRWWHCGMSNRTPRVQERGKQIPHPRSRKSGGTGFGMRRMSMRWWRCGMNE